MQENIEGLREALKTYEKELQSLNKFKKDYFSLIDDIHSLVVELLKTGDTKTIYFVIFFFVFFFPFFLCVFYFVKQKKNKNQKQFDVKPRLTTQLKDGNIFV